MSHLVTIRTEVRAPVHRTVRLFRDEATGLAVELSGWRYPVVCQTETGELRYDNFSGRWGAEQELHRFQQTYAIEKAKLELRRQGHTPLEQVLADGFVRVRAVAAA
jgi:hypothetical protein